MRESIDASRNRSSARRSTISPRMGDLIRIRLCCIPPRAHHRHVIARFASACFMKTGATTAITALAGAMGCTLGIEDASGKPFLPGAMAGPARVPVVLEGSILGWATGPSAAAGALASLLMHLAAKESERRALASEVLQLYRQVNLIERLSEQLAAVLDLSAAAPFLYDSLR